MTFKNILNYSYRFSQARMYVKKRKMLLWGSEVVETSFERNCQCLRNSADYSTSYSLMKKSTRFVKFLAADMSSLAKITPRKEQSFKNDDQVPEDFCLIYKVAVDNYITYGRRITTLGLIFLFGIGITKTYHLFPLIVWDAEIFRKNTYHDSDIVKSESDFLICCMSLTLFVSALQSMASKFPLRLYHNPVTDEYIAVFSNILGFPKKFYFNKAETKKLKPSGFLPWKDCYFSIQSKKVILLEHSFRIPADYNALLGIEDHESCS